MNEEDLGKALSLCVRCGRCRGVCPTFEVLGSETAVARGRVVLAQHLAEGDSLTPAAPEILNTCLLCMACEEVCTNKVPVAELVQLARHRLHHQMRPQRWKNALSWVLSHPKAMDLLGTAGGLASQLAPSEGEPRGLLLRIPGFLEENLFLPPISSRPFRLREEGGREGNRGKVLVFLGCLVDHCYPETAEATIRLLEGLGYGYTVPEEQYCCGHPHMAMGFTEDAKRIIERNLRVFRGEEPDAIVTPCASCASTLKREYHLSIPVLDTMELITRHLDQLSVTLPQGVERVTWHTPCHLGRGQGIYPMPAVERLLGHHLAHLKDHDRCCGFGGTLSVEFSGLSLQVGREKAERIRETGAELVLTDCPACIMQLQHSLFDRGVPARADHILNILC